jgi:pyrroline-5-carboxylate reductase
MIRYQLGIVGGGNMAEAILRGLARSHSVPHHAIVAFDPSLKRRQVLAMEFGIICAGDNRAPGACPRVLLAVKPQVLPAVLEEIAPVIRPDATVISIVAGKTTAYIDSCLGGKGRIVRVMPNTPMLIGAGVSAVAAGPRATEEDVQWTQKIFAASGKTVVVEEAAMDAVTGVSGTGPAYFFYLIEAMIAAGVADGLDPEVAALLSIETCIGAGKLLAETLQPPEALRAQVTTPNGTTQRAMETLEAAKVKEKLIAAFRAATQRSRELGQESTLR